MDNQTADPQSTSVQPQQNDPFAALSQISQETQTINTPTLNNQPAGSVNEPIKSSDPSTDLMSILKGEMKVEKMVEKKSDYPITTKPKFANEFLEGYVERLRKADLDDAAIVDALLVLDKQVEDGEITNENIDKIISENTK